MVLGSLLVFAANAGAGLDEQLETRCHEIENSMYPMVEEPDVKIAMAQDYYFYGDRCVSSDRDKMDWHTKGLEAARAGVQLLNRTDNPKKWALGHYYAAVNLSLWGLAKGKLASLGSMG